MSACLHLFQIVQYKLYCCSKLISGSLFRSRCTGIDHDGGQKRNIKQLKFLIVRSGYIKQFEFSRHAIQLSIKIVSLFSSNTIPYVIFLGFGH